MSMFLEQLQQIEEIKSKIYDKITSFPQNKNIRIISDKPRCFIVMKSEIIGTVLNPEYYDFECQYKVIVEKLRDTDTSNFERVLSDIITTKKMIVKHEARSYTCNFHPNVIEYLKQITK